MQLADISVERRKGESFLKQLLWPQVHSQRDADMVGEQGLWLCTLVAAVWIVGGMFTARPYLGALIGITYLLGAMGVRRHSVAAAVLVFLCLFLDRVAALEAMLLGVPGGGNPRVGVVVILLLFLNIRATLLARRWQGGSLPQQQALLPAATSFRDRFANRWPSVLWPRVRYVFYVLAGLILLTSVVALFSLPSMHREQVSRQGSNVVNASRR